MYNRCPYKIIIQVDIYLNHKNIINKDNDSGMKVLIAYLNNPKLAKCGRIKIKLLIRAEQILLKTITQSERNIQDGHL